MRKAVLGLAVAGLFVATGGHAIACEGGKVVFEDKFSDDAGGWAGSGETQRRPPSFRHRRRAATRLQ